MNDHYSNDFDMAGEDPHAFLAPWLAKGVTLLSEEDDAGAGCPCFTLEFASRGEHADFARAYVTGETGEVDEAALADLIEEADAWYEKRVSA